MPTLGLNLSLTIYSSFYSMRFVHKCFLHFDRQIPCLSQGDLQTKIFFQVRIFLGTWVKFDKDDIGCLKRCFDVDNNPVPFSMLWCSAQIIIKIYVYNYKLQQLMNIYPLPAKAMQYRTDAHLTHLMYSYTKIRSILFLSKN